MNKYRIVGRTNGWIAARDAKFNGKTMVVLENDMTLKEAQKKLLDMFNRQYDKGFKNWGLVRCNYPYDSFTRNDGTRSFEYDSRKYVIEKYEEKKWYTSSYNAVDEDGDVMDLAVDCEYFMAEDDVDAVAYAKSLASKGVDYEDVGHVNLELVSVCRVDPENEWEEIETVWF